MIHTTTFLQRLWGLALLLFFVSSNVFGQNLISHIPQEALFVAELDLDQLDKKASLDSIGKMPFIKEFTRKAPKMVKDPTSFGIDSREQLVFFYGAGDEMNYMAFLVPLEDMSKFREVQQLTGGEWMAEPTNNFFTLMEKKASFGGEQEKILGAFNESFLLFFNAMPTPNAELYDPNMSWEEREEQRKKANEMKAVKTMAKITEIMELSGVRGINNTPDFKEGFSRKGDLNLWVDSRIGYGSYEKILRRNPMFSSIYNQLKSFTDGGYTSGSISMKDGQMVMDIQSKTNPELEEMVEEITKAKINKRFAHYIQEEEVLGYASFAFNSYNLGKAYRKTFAPMMDSLPNVPPGMGTALFEVLEIFIDEEAIAELIPGNMMIALTGIETYDKEYKTYEYNDSTYERQEVIKTKQDVRPEFTFMLSTEREEDMANILEALSKAPLGKRKGNPIVNQGFYYNIPEAKKNLGMDFYLALQNGILFITNNSDLVQNHLMDGYGRKERLSRTHRKAMRKSNQLVYMNFDRLFDQMKQLPGRQFQSDEPQQALEILSSNMDEIWSRNYRRKDPGHSTLRVKLKNEDQNALGQMAEMINEVYLATNKRPRRDEEEATMEEIPEIEEMEKKDKD